ncbi:MAG: DUF1669 domain-containing protein [Marinilabiliaceae bacterium]|nr:DUF1669 domain-containing protein [Marinilabiliaceae bacterium]
MKETLEHLQTSLEDAIMTRGEKKALKAILQDKHLTKNELNCLRSEVFKLAKGQVSEFKNEQIIDWLEEANKLILPKTETGIYTKSFFSPGTSCLDTINMNIGSATRKIDICVFTISDDRIRDKILYAINKGISVRIITDDDKTMDKGSDIEFLLNRGAKVKMDDSPHHMHHKFALFDDEILLTGSYNWTRSASQYNQENILETNDPKAIDQYKKEFERLWAAFE